MGGTLGNGKQLYRKGAKHAKTRVNPWQGLVGYKLFISLLLNGVSANVICSISIEEVEQTLRQEVH